MRDSFTPLIIMTSISQAIISQSSNSDKFGAVPAKDEGRSSNRKDLIETFLTIKEPDRSDLKFEN